MHWHPVTICLKRACLQPLKEWSVTITMASYLKRHSKWVHCPMLQLLCCRLAGVANTCRVFYLCVGSCMRLFKCSWPFFLHLLYTIDRYSSGSRCLHPQSTNALHHFSIYYGLRRQSYCWLRSCTYQYLVGRIYETTHQPSRNTWVMYLCAIMWHCGENVWTQYPEYLRQTNAIQLVQTGSGYSGGKCEHFLCNVMPFLM